MIRTATSTPFVYHGAPTTGEARAAAAREAVAHEHLHLRLMEALFTVDLPALAQALADGADPNAYYQPPTGKASGAPKLPLFHVLDRWGETREALQALDLLLRHGARTVYPPQATPRVPLVDAARHGLSESARLLLRHGAPIDHTGLSCIHPTALFLVGTAAHTALEGREEALVDVARQLLDAGASMSQRNARHETPLEHAFHTGHAMAAQALLTVQPLTRVTGLALCDSLMRPGDQDRLVDLIGNETDGEELRLLLKVLLGALEPLAQADADVERQARATVAHLTHAMAHRIQSTVHLPLLTAVEAWEEALGHLKVFESRYALRGGMALSGGKQIRARL